MRRFLAALGLCCREGFALVAASGGHSRVALCRLLSVAASPVEHRLSGARAWAAAACGLSSCSSQALEHRLSSGGTWNLAALWRVGPSQTRDQNRVHCIDRQILIHCTTREVQA